MPFIIKSTPFMQARISCDRHFVCENIPIVDKCKNYGFTIIELVVTMAVAAVLFTVAMPSLRNLISSTRLTTITNSVLTDIATARNTATTLRARVIICSSNNGSSCDGSGWRSGRLIYWEKPPYGTGPVAGTNTIRYTEALPTTVTQPVAATYPDPLIFDANGRPIDFFGAALVATTPMPIVLTLCDAEKRVTGRQISINASGQSTSNPFTCP